MAKLELKLRVQELRKRGESIKQIAKKLDAPVSTVSTWCRDIKLTPEQIEKLTELQSRGTYKGILKAAEKKREERKEKVELLKKKGIKDIGRISEREFFISGVALYWGEGFKTKGGSVGVSIGNVDMLKFFIKWFEKYLKGDRQKLQLRVTINEQHKNREKFIKKFWIKELNVNAGQFQKTMFISSESPKIYYSRKTYHGTLRVVLPKSTDYLRLINGWIEGLYKITKNMSG